MWLNASGMSAQRPGTACTPAITTVRPMEMDADDNTLCTMSLLSCMSRQAAKARPSTRTLDASKLLGFGTVSWKTIKTMR